MMYWKLAIQNIRRSLRDYIIYFVTLTFTALCDVLLFRDELFYYESFGLFAVLILVQLAATGAALSSHRTGYLRWSSYRHVCC